MKHLIVVLLLSGFLSVSAAEPNSGLIPKDEIPSDIIIIIPESIEPEIAATPMLTPEECGKLSHQLDSLSVVEGQADKKMFELRRAMDEIKEKGIIPMLVYSGLQPEVLNQNLNLFWQLSVKHDEFQRQRNKAYDAIEFAFQKLTASCNYKPEGTS